MNIRTLCLGILQFDDATGYEINKLVADGRFSHFIEASYGSIYPALTKMMQEELVTCRTEIQAGKPSRKVYAITPAGQAELFRALEESPKPNRFKSEFLFLGLFANALPPALIAKAFAQHERELSALVKDMQAHYDRCKNPGSQFAIGYGIAANKAALEYLHECKDLLLEGDQSKDLAQDVANETTKEASYE
ncbi:MAG: PadR family transcriptional regulator [bacterium]|nr:PadR family transcriptional regulator [bacterium]